MIKHHTDLLQGSLEWLQARLGILTASEMKHVLTPTLKLANNDKTRAHVYEIAAQRISQYVEPHYVSDDMLRGQADEILAREAYAKHHAPVEECGFITNNKWGFTLGYSPDALVGTSGLIECKSRRQKFQVQTIAEAEVPEEYWMQLQTGLLVSEREWLDFVSYSGGLPMLVLRVEPCIKTQEAILEAADAFEGKVSEVIAAYDANVRNLRSVPTERTIIMEMF
jgi:predicted phage-related endonuclease